MHGVALLVAFSTLGIDHTWRETEAGRVEYVVQIEPVFLQQLREGKEITSELPAGIERVDRLCLRIGSGDVSQLSATVPDWEQLHGPPEQPAAGGAPGAPLSAVYLCAANGQAYECYDLTHGWQPAARGTVQYLVQIAPNFLGTLSEGDEVYLGVSPQAGEVRSFTITAGSQELPRDSGLPPVTTVAQLQAGGNRGSSAAADVPPVTDLTGGTGSVYGGASSRAADQSAADNAAAATLQPPTGLLDVPTFDREQFSTRPGKSTAAGGTGRRGTPQPAAGTGAARYAAEQPAARRSQQPFNDEITAAQYLPEEEGTPRVASRSPRNAGDDGSLRRGAGFVADNAADEKKPEFPALPFTLSLFALFLSMGANLYLGWTAAEFYSRYKLAVERLRGAGR